MALNSRRSTLDWRRVDALIDLALEEDLGSGGDITSCALVAEDTRCRAHILAKAPGTVAGLDVARRVFARVVDDLSWSPEVSDGDRAAAGAVLVELGGRARGVLAAERTALNFLGRLSGIATRTRAAVAVAAPLGVEVLDTRKTMPGWRDLEKYAVRCGGGRNHRRGLYDAVLVKDNHRKLAGAGGPAELGRALSGAHWPDGVFVMVEVETEAELLAALEAGVDGLLLDNRDPAELARLTARAKTWCAAAGRAVPVLEASGGLRPETLAAAAAAGVDRVSLGAITHSAPWLDVSLELL